MKKTNKYISGLMSAVMVLSLSCSAVPFSFTAAAENTAYPEEVIGDFAPVLEYDNSPMRVGETREVRISSRFVSDIKVTGITEISKNLSCEYDKNSDTFTITALAEGSAKAYVMGKDCAFGSYLHIEILPETVTTATTAPFITTGTATTAKTTPAAESNSYPEEVIGDFAPVLEYDNSPMRIGETREVRISSRFVSDIKVTGITEISKNLSYKYDKNSDTFTITALAEGSAKAYVMGKDCAFGSYLHIEILPESATETTPLVMTTCLPATTTSAATTTTVIYDYATMLEYDNSPMKVGETRKVRVYNPHLSNMTVNSIYESTDNISCSYDKNSDTVTITALAEGNAKAYIMGSGCAFGSYLNIEILPESATETTPLVMTTCLPATTTSAATTTTVIYDYATMLEYDNSPMQVGETRKVRVYNPHLSNMTVSNIYESTDNISCSYDKNSDTVTITALAEGKAKAYVMGTGCAFGTYLNIEILPENTAETSTGDANCDGKVNMGDVVLIMQSIANPDKYGLNGTDTTHITSQGTLNGDTDGNGITNNDALAIQKKLLGLT